MKKQFIAGAVCPACGLVDKIYILKEADQESMHCSQCDYVEVKGENKPPSDTPAGMGEWSPVKLPDK